MLKNILFVVLAAIATLTATSQSNTPCSGTVTLPVNATCVYTAGTTVGATYQTNANNGGVPGCASPGAPDVWYLFTAPASGSVFIETTAGTITDGGMEVYSGSCGAWVSLGCDDDSGTGLMPQLTLPGLTPGVTYAIRFWQYGGTGTGTFNICIQSISITAPANDECAGATALTVNPNNLCGTVTAGTIEYATASAQANTCGGTDDDDVWYSFVATGTSHLISLLNITGSTSDLYISVFSGTCGSIGAPILCSDPESTVVSGLTPGNTYYVRVYSWTSTTGQTSDFNICIGTPPPPPANDECAGAIALTVNPTNICTTVTPGTIYSATASAQANTCGGTDDDDIWYSFVATGTAHLISLLNITGSTSDLYISVFSGTCGSIGAPILCSDPETTVVSGLTPGNTYYVRIYSWTSTTGQTSAFNVCIGTPPPPPANDECAGAVNVPVSTSTCSYVTGTIYSATASAQANSCGGTDDDDVWYSFVATSPSVQISMANVSGSTTDLYHAVYSGTCGSIGAALVCSDPNNSTVTGLTIGNTYYVRIYSWTSTAGQTTTFDLCIMEAGACGTPSNQDYCVAPAILTQGPGNFSSSTSGTYTSDTPANLNSVFCGSIENNSWYQFTATATSHTFSFTSVTGGSCSWGVQAEVYNVTEDVNGCCTNFASTSNCWNPGTMSTGTVTATGLTIGNTYLLMVDGNAGSVCDYTVSNWEATGILSHHLLGFTGEALPHANQLNWRTSQEMNSNHYKILRSTDGINFDVIGTIASKGNSNVDNDYIFNDNNLHASLYYYKISEVSNDGIVQESSVITIIRNPVAGDIQLYPNPAVDLLTIEGSTNFLPETYKITDLSGKLITSGNFNSGNAISLYDIENGIYLINVTDASGASVSKTFVKQ
jgi:hypothetical protein